MKSKFALLGILLSLNSFQAASAWPIDTIDCSGANGRPRDISCPPIQYPNPPILVGVGGGNYSGINYTSPPVPKITTNCTVLSGGCSVVIDFGNGTSQTIFINLKNTYSGDPNHIPENQS